MALLFGASAADAGLKIYYIRHAEGGHNVKADWVKRGVPEAEWPSYVGNPDIFTPLGFKQQAAVAAKLKKYKFDFIASSPLWRCRNTILPYMKEVGAKGEIWPELREQRASASILRTDMPTPVGPILGAGPLVEMPDDELAYFSIRKDGTHRFKVPKAGNDKAADIRSSAAARVVIQDVIDRVQKRFGGTDKSILFAGHGSSGKAVLRMLTQDPLTGFPGISNTGIWMVEEQEDGTFELKMFNDEPYVAKKAEAKNLLRKKFIPADKNNDSRLTKAEYVTYCVANFDRKDADGNGGISKAEHGHSSFDRADANKDGLLDKKEYATIFAGQFDNAYDKNGDGIVTAAESNDRK